MDIIEQIISRLIEIHTASKQRIDFEIDDRKKAIWYVQGCAISTSESIFSMYLGGYAVAASHQWRFVNELRDLVALFDRIQDDDRRVKAWYRGEVIERKRNEPINDVVNRLLGDEFYSKEIEARKALMDSLSTFVHPTVKVVRYNVYKKPNTEEFDYDWSTLRINDEILIIVKTSLICAIHCLNGALNTLRQPIEVENELNLLYAKINNIK